MMSNKKNLEFDPDFSDLGNTKKVVQKSPRPSESKSTESDIPVLSIPQKEGRNRFISKTIKECSGSEFVKWADGLGRSLPMDEEYYNEEKNRKRAFEEIIRLIRVDYIRSNPKIVKTLH